MIIRPADRTASVKEYYFSRKLKEIDSMNAEIWESAHRTECLLLKRFRNSGR